MLDPDDAAVRRRGLGPGKLNAGVCQQARTEVFNIACNVQFCSQNGTREGSACTLTFADFDRLANWLYIFAYNDSDKGRRMARAGLDPENRMTPEFRTDTEIADGAQMAGAPKADDEHPVKEEWALNFFLDKLKPGASLVAMSGPHTYTFLRNADDKQIYLYDSWTPGSTIHTKGSEGYNIRVKDGLTYKDPVTQKEKPMVLLLKRGL